jgi:ADP-heptose:LPS heptosyltransferase
MKFLLLRYSSIGDIVLATPVLRCLRKQFPDAEIAFATKAKFATLLEPNPHCDKVFGLGGDQPEHIGYLKEYDPDRVIDLHHNLRTARIKAALRKPSRSFDKLNLEKWLLVNFKWNLMPYRHIVERYLDAVEDLGVHYDGAGLDYYFPADAAATPKGLPEVPFYAYAVGGQHGTKRMPPDRIRAALEQAGSPVVLLGDKNDALTLKGIENGLPMVHNHCGRYSLAESARVVEKAAVVVSHDTGLMHIAAALRKPIVSIWGNTVPDFGMTPFYPEGFDRSLCRIIEEEELSCRPCSKIGYETCPRGHFACMRMPELDGLFKPLAHP